MQFSETLWRNLGLKSPDAFFGAIMSLVRQPPGSAVEQALCRYLLAIQEFYSYIVNPGNFERGVLLALCRTLMRVDLQFDVKLVSALADDPSVTKDTFLRALSVLDETSAGGRLTMTLARVSRDSDPVVAAKIAMLMGKRVSNPLWVERQLTSTDARTRANVIETLWGVDTAQARKSLNAALKDTNNRVVGNALVGLHLLGDESGWPHLHDLAAHPEPTYRTTAIWVVSKTRDRRNLALLNSALEDPDPKVRTAAERALADFPVEAAAPESPASPNAKPVDAPAKAMPPQVQDGPPPASEAKPTTPAQPGRIPDAEEKEQTRVGNLAWLESRISKIG